MTQPSAHNRGSCAPTLAMTAVNAHDPNNVSAHRRHDPTQRTQSAIVCARRRCWRHRPGRQPNEVIRPNDARPDEARSNEARVNGAPFNGARSNEAPFNEVSRAERKGPRRTKRCKSGSHSPEMTAASGASAPVDDAIPWPVILVGFSRHRAGSPLGRHPVIAMMIGRLSTRGDKRWRDKVGGVCGERWPMDRELRVAEGGVGRPTVDDGRPTTSDRRQATGDRQQATGNRRQATGDRQRATGNERQAAGGRRQAAGGDQR
ncbi:hypothetical protein BC793_13752 [Actinoplanes xinjiangensis]|uniref:Uncharacterized protein n=1 Tax=Actinoplanes xinjiangensis TaxID=512350 RepID=A0A316EHE6_9ACTN|nr:hypothetical protein BC793_13752 [Actinoplanes xinjiangensis]